MRHTLSLFIGGWLLALVACAGLIGASNVDGGCFRDIQHRGSLGSYLRYETLTQQLNLGIHSLHLTLHHGREACLHPGKPIPGDWYVYQMCMVNDETNVMLLSQALTEVATWSHHPTRRGVHKPVVLWLEFQDFNMFQPHEVDGLLWHAFGPRLFTPAHFMARHPHASTMHDVLHHALKTNASCGAWPTLSEMRGRVLAVVEYGQAIDYACTDQVANARAAFVGAHAFRLGQRPASFVIWTIQDGTSAKQVHAGRYLRDAQFMVRHVFHDITDTDLHHSLEQGANFIDSWYSLDSEQERSMSNPTTTHWRPSPTDSHILAGALLQPVTHVPPEDTRFDMLICCLCALGFVFMVCNRW